MAVNVNAAPCAVGVITPGFTAQFWGVPVVPGTQLKLTLLAYPLRAKIIPVYVAVCDAKIVCGLLATLN